MTTTRLHHEHAHASPGLEVGLQLVTMAAKALLILGGAVLLGEAVAEPARKLLAGRRAQADAANESGEPVI